MRTWLAPVVMVLVLVWVWWMRHQLRTAYLGRLVAAAKGSESRARRVTLIWQSGVAAIGVALVAVGALAQWSWDLPAVRIGLMVLVIGVIVPLGSIVAGRDATRSKRRVQVRRSVQDRLSEAGASRAVADAVVQASRPFAYVSFVLAMVASVLLVWHD